jgi:hypothetical protein
MKLEGDALQVVQALQKECCNLSKYGHIIEEAEARVVYPQSCEGSTHS